MLLSGDDTIPYLDSNFVEDIDLFHQLEEIGNTEYHPDMQVKMNYSSRWYLPFTTMIAILGAFISLRFHIAGTLIMSVALGIAMTDIMKRDFNIDVPYSLMAVSAIIAVAVFSYGGILKPVETAFLSGLGVGALIHSYTINRGDIT